MRSAILAALILLTMPLSGCTSDRTDLQCDAATSFLSNELINSDDEEFVYGSSDDETTFDVSWLAAADRNKAVSDFAEESWFDLKGGSIWQGEEFEQIAKTSDEIKLVSQLFDMPKATNAVTQCSGIRAVLRDRSIAYGEDAVKSASAVLDPQLEEHSKTIADIYLPVLSDDGRSAVLLVSRNWAPLAGVGLIIKIERQDNGEWRPTRAQQVWVS